MPIRRTLFLVVVIAMWYLPPKNSENVFVAGNIWRCYKDSATRFEHPIGFEEESVRIGGEMLKDLSQKNEIE